MASNLMLMIEAYLLLLRMTHHTSSRARLQPVLAGLRDEIARLSGWFPERVQDHCEAVADLMSMEGRRE
jgi:hypothetical protein